MFNNIQTASNMTDMQRNWGMELNLVYPYGRLIQRAVNNAKVLLNNNVDEGHSIEHCVIVMRNACKASDHYSEDIRKKMTKQRSRLNVLLDDVFSTPAEIKSCMTQLSVITDNIMTPLDKLAVALAALLHEVDDRKLFDTTDYSNARCILKDIFEDSDNLIAIIPLVIEMIDVTSCSKNGNSVAEPRWKLIPRDSDRIEAIGEIGIWRAYVYTIGVDRPMFDDETARVTNDEELALVATSKRFDQYQVVKKSRTLIDHFYDKIVHIGDLQSKNPYLQKIADERMRPIKNFLFEFGRTGKIPKIKNPNKIML